MPNNTAQLLTVTGDASIIEAMKKFVRNDDGVDLDHDTFFQMPDKLKHTSHPAQIMTEDEIKQQWIKYHNLPENSWEKKQGYPMGLGLTQQQSDELKAEFGADNWYDWTNNNYGTKWGIYDQGEWQDNNTILFYSAWSPANLIIEKLSGIYPQLSFVLEAADEGGGFVCRYLISGGVSSYEDFKWEEADGIEIRKNVGHWGDEDEIEYCDTIPDDITSDE